MGSRYSYSHMSEFLVRREFLVRCRHRFVRQYLLDTFTQWFLYICKPHYELWVAQKKSAAVRLAEIQTIYTVFL